ncbi:MAG: TCP-1/cpn60 chaperonin family protein [Euryarchaeota archaeon]
MAQPNDGSGRAPVAIVRPTTSVTSGVAVTQKLVSASVAFGDLLRGTFGPNGLDKMMYKTSGETAVTNDGAKIVAELLVKHPAAKAFVQLAQSQENACGDGVTGCLIVASELMREAGRLLEKGLHPLVLVEGYQRALQVTLDTLEARVEHISPEDNPRLLAVAKTAMMGTTAESGSDHLAQCIVTAAKTVATELNGVLHVRTEDVRMAKRGIGGIADTRLVAGLILERRLDLDRLPRHLANGKVAVLSCPLEIETSSREAEIEVTSPDQWVAFMDAEEAQLEAKAQAVLDCGATLVVCAEGIDSRILHRCVDAGVFALAGLERTGAEDVAAATGAMMIDHLDSLDESVLGTFESMHIETLEGEDARRERLHIHVGEAAGLATIDVGGGDGVASEEVIRGLYDALCSVTSAMETGEVLLGGGSLHMAASLAIKEAAEAQGGRERLAMEAFARSLEAIPAVLATNAGHDHLDTLLALRSLHRDGSPDSGVQQTGHAGPIESAWSSAETLAHAIEAACETACGLLRVDQVISARGD